MRLIFDCETNGLEATVVHSLVIKDVDSGEVWSCNDHGSLFTISCGLSKLANATTLIGHNLIKYDLPTLKRIYPQWTPRGLVRDTLTIASLIWTEIENDDFRRRDAGSEMPATLIGKQSLKSWGYRLGVLKGHFNESADWSVWTPEMQGYCEQDVEVTYALWKAIEKQAYSEQAIQLEHDFQQIIYQQEKHGFRFDEPAAGALAAKLLHRRGELTGQLQALVPPTVETMKTPEYYAASNEFAEVARGETKGIVKTLLKQKGIRERAVTILAGPLKTRTTPFNPGSRQQVGEYLKSKGWKPRDFTPTGQPEVNEAILSKLTIEGSPALCELFTVNKLLGQLSEGDNAWLKLSRNGRIHGAVKTNGAVTGRVTHFKPNMSQVPSVGSLYGKECRALFIADPGQVLVDSDASGLELRCLSHFLARYDGGEYAKLVCEGDVHSFNRDALGFTPDKAGRDRAKTWVYGWLYGAGGLKLGTVAGFPESQAAQEGERLKRQFLKKIPALAKLKNDIAAAAGRGYLIGLDGRKLHVRSAHAALNTLLQSAGAVVVKKANVILIDSLTKSGLQFGRDYAQVGFYHDEMCFTCRPDIAEQVATSAKEAFRLAGEHFKFRCPLAGEAKIGGDWSKVH